MIGFLRDNARWLGTGFLLTMFSAFGQTWFISLFAGQLKDVHGLTDGSWGSLYTVATLASATLLFLRGALADTMPLSRLAPGIALMFAASCLLIAWAPSVWLLGVALFGLRFCGQGMFTHIAMTAMGRWFVAARGRAVAIAAFGQSLGEMLLPLPILLLVGLIGWQLTWSAVALLLACVIAPVLFMLLARNRTPRGHVEGTQTPGLGGRHWTRGQVVRHWLFPALLPFLLTPGFIGTVIFFHQVHIADVKGWTLTQMAPGYAVFATLTILSNFASGFFVDRFGPRRLLPLYLVPMGIGITIVGPAGAVYGWFAALAFNGLTQGMTGALMGTLLPTLYGTKNLGSIRSLISTVGVVSTAIGPGITGILIDQGIVFPRQCLALGLWCFALSLSAIPISRRLARETS